VRHSGHVLGLCSGTDTSPSMSVPSTRPASPRPGRCPACGHRRGAAAPSRPILYADGTVGDGRGSSRTERAGGRGALGGARCRTLRPGAVQPRVVAQPGGVATSRRAPPGRERPFRPIPATRQAELAHIAVDANPKAAIVDAGRPRRLGQRRQSHCHCHHSRFGAAAPGKLFALDLATVDDPALLALQRRARRVHPRARRCRTATSSPAALALVTAWRWDGRRSSRTGSATVPPARARRRFARHAGGGRFRAVLQPSFESVPPSFAPLMSTAPRCFFGVPTMYHRLAESPHASELSKLRLCVAGSAPLAPELFHARRATLRPAGARALTA